MATANDIAQNAGYLGNSNLGGGNFGVITIDSKPLENLAAYTYAYNKTKWEQQQKDAQEKAKELADFTAYDLTTAIPEDSKKIQKEWNELYSWVQSNPTVLDYKNNQKGFLEYKKKRNDFENNLKNAKSRDIVYKSGLTAAEKETNAAIKNQLQSQLDQQIKADSDLATPIRLQQYDAKIPEIPVAPMVTFDVGIIDENGNFNRDRTIKMADQKFINSKAAEIGLGLQSNVLDETSAEFISLTPEQQQTKRDEFKTRSASGKLLPVETAATFNQALAEYKTENGIDLNKMKSNPILAGTLKSIDDYNRDMRQMKEQIKAGVYRDKAGKKLQFGMDGVDEYDYEEIDYTDGEVSAIDLLKVQLKAKALPTSFDTKTDETDLAIKKDDNARGWAELAFRKRQAAKETPANAPEFIQDPATLFGNHAQRVASFYQRNPNAPTLVAKFGKVDNETRIATGLQEGQEIEYKRDGSWNIIAETDIYQKKDGKFVLDKDDEKILQFKKGQVVKTGTIEGLKKGYIDAVKIGQGTDGAQTEGFQQKSESGFINTFGSNDANAIFNSFMTGNSTPAPQSTQQAAAPVESSSSVSVSYKVKGKTYTKKQLNDAGWSDEQINAAKSAGKIN